MSLLFQCSVVKQFNFNGKTFQSVHVNREECLVSRDVNMAIEFKEENGKKAIENLVTKKFLCLRDVNTSLNQGEDIFLLHKHTVLLKEPGLYCFLLRCKKSETEPSMERILETV